MIEYQLTTLKDIYDKVPADRIGVLLRELGIAMHRAKTITELLGVTASSIAGSKVEYTIEWPDVFTWVDDGEGTINVKVIDEDGNDLYNTAPVVPGVAVSSEPATADLIPPGHQ